MRCKRRSLATSMAGLAIGAPLATACGQNSDDDATRAVKTSNPASTFAPLVRLDPRETLFPMSTRHFLTNAGLEWKGGPCGLERDVSASAATRNPRRPLDPARLGRPPGYELTPWRANCSSPRAETYSSTMHTRPFDTRDRPVGLHLHEGFGLDILTAAQPGARRLRADRTLGGVPAYYAIERAPAGRRPDLRLSYWLLFGSGERRDRDHRNRLVEHEGDWERIDVRLRSARGRHRYVPVSVRFHSDDGVRTVDWRDAERAGPGSTHPAARLAPRSHTPSPDAACNGCTDWSTWRNLRDVRKEPWYGYGGAWGVVATTDASTGSLGPSPFDLGPPPAAYDKARHE